MTATMPGMRMPDGSHAIAVPVVPVTENGDYAAVEAKNAVFSAYAKTGVTVTSYAILVDLSDTVNWPHKGTSYATLFKTYLSVDKANNTQGNLRLGVITRVDGTSADIAFVNRIDFDNSSDQHITRDRSFSPSVLSLQQSAGKLVGAATTGYVTNVTAVKTGTPLESFLGPATVIPAVGDVIIMFEVLAGGPFSATVSTFYMGWPPS